MTIPSVGACHRAFLIQAVLLLVAFGFTARAQAESTVLASVNPQGQTGNNYSDRPAISADGRYVAFQSSATDLVSGDTNGKTDIFVYDRDSASVTRISVGVDGFESNNDSSSPAISSDGRYIAFESLASNLVSGDTNNLQDIFVYDRVAAKTVRVSVHSNGAESNDAGVRPSISGDGRFIVFLSGATTLADGDGNIYSDVFLHDRDSDSNGVFDEGNDTTTRVSASTDGSSNFPTISRDGLYIAFSSVDTALVNSDTNGFEDVFVYDRQNATTERVSVSATNQQVNGGSVAPSLSDDGRYVAFASDATDLVAGDTNLKTDIFIRDRTLQQTIRASLTNSDTASGSASTMPVISGNGRYVAFASESAALTAAVAYTRALKNTSGRFDAVSAATGGSGGGSGTTIAKIIYRRDLLQNDTVRISSNNGGTSSNGSSESYSLSFDGTLAAFSSKGSNLVCTSDTNAANDIFIRDLNTATAAIACATTTTTTTAASAGGGAIVLSGLIPLFGSYLVLRHLRRRRCNRSE